ncbi:glycoside hydrolase family 16 protein [Xylariaceae sp. FL0804]|nr:glycoside hydrolase family 16 protein [Xylariaceae sp. FL0804]
MSFRDHFNQLKNKAEELNKKHNILPIGQNKQPQQGYYGGSGPAQNYYPGQYQAGQGQWQQPPPHAPQGQWQQPPPAPPQGHWQSAPPPQPDYSTRPSGHHPPPIPPSNSRPGGSSGGDHTAAWNYDGAAAAPPPPAPGVYWRPTFAPHVAVSQEFEHKTGHGSPYGWGNDELENYTSGPANSFHTSDGRLVVRAIASPGTADPEARYTSARLVSRRTLGRASGVVTAVLALPSAAGIWPAFWMLPREPFAWPREGEVDIAEAWDGRGENHSCLHWGAYTPQDNDKHRVRVTPLPPPTDHRDGHGRGHGPVRFDFAWRCDNGAGPGGEGGRLMWYVDGRPVMRNLKPAGTRAIEDWCLLLNVAMGGQVCGGRAPAEGVYDMVVHDLHMSEAPEKGGWARFESDWQRCPDGAVM